MLKNKLNQDKLEEKLTLPLEKIASQAILAGEILHNMKKFMREENFYVEKTDINQLIHDTLSIFHYELDNFKLKISLDLAENLPPILVNKTHIIQIILNIIRNSFEALQEEGIEDPKLSITTNESSNYIYVHIRDNGPGVPEELIDKILKSHFTTKKEGTGIGLSISRTLLEKHGGKLTYQRNEKRGAWFTFTLPIENNQNHDCINI